MFIIDDKKLKLTDQTIFVGDFNNCGTDGYNIRIQLEFINVDTNEKGYINLDAGFEECSNIKTFLNREYCGVPFGKDEHIFFEVFDTEKFLDTEIESDILIKFEGIKDNKIKVYFEVEDELIKIKFDGYLDVDLSRTRDTFCG